MDQLATFLGRALDALARRADRLVERHRQRYYEQHLGRVGSGVRFNGRSRITGLDRIEIGDNVHVGDGAFIRGDGGLVIGANTHISRNLVLYTHNHDYEGEALPYDASFRERPVHVGRNVWIGMNVTILPGTRIGDGAVVGAGSVVVGEVEPLAIVGAPPAQVLRHRDRERYERLEREGRYGGVGGRPLPPATS